MRSAKEIIGWTCINFDVLAFSRVVVMYPFKHRGARTCIERQQYQQQSPPAELAGVPATLPHGREE
eukprot:2276546-Pleurochrysis_carterae.AAC.1